MEKIKFKNETILEFTSISEYNNLINVTFMDTDFDYLKTQFGNPSNLSTIEILTEGDVLCAIYEDYNKVDRYIITEDEISVQISKPNEIEKRLDTVEDAVNTLILDALEG